MLSTQNYHDDSDLAVGQNPGNLVPWFKSKLQGWLDVHPKVSIISIAGRFRLLVGHHPLTQTHGLQTHGLSRPRARAEAPMTGD